MLCVDAEALISSCLVFAATDRCVVLVVWAWYNDRSALHGFGVRAWCFVRLVTHVTLLTMPCFRWWCSDFAWVCCANIVLWWIDDARSDVTNGVLPFMLPPFCKVVCAWCSDRSATHASRLASSTLNRTTTFPKQYCLACVERKFVKTKSRVPSSVKLIPFR